MWQRMMLERESNGGRWSTVVTPKEEGEGEGKELGKEEEDEGKYDIANAVK